MAAATVMANDQSMIQDKIQNKIQAGPRRFDRVLGIAFWTVITPIYNLIADAIPFARIVSDSLHLTFSIMTVRPVSLSGSRHFWPNVFTRTTPE